MLSKKKKRPRRPLERGLASPSGSSCRELSNHSRRFAVRGREHSSSPPAYRRTSNRSGRPGQRTPTPATIAYSVNTTYIDCHLRHVTFLAFSKSFLPIVVFPIHPVSALT